MRIEIPDLSMVACGMQIPGFIIKEKISAGKVTDTWLAHQESLDRTVVLKVLTPRYASNQKEVNTFVNEARSAAKLRHPNIVQLFDVRQHEDTFYLVLEHVAGTNLQDRLDTMQTAFAVGPTPSSLHRSRSTSVVQPHRCWAPNVPSWAATAVCRRRCSKPRSSRAWPPKASRCSASA